MTEEQECEHEWQEEDDDMICSKCKAWTFTKWFFDIRNEGIRIGREEGLEKATYSEMTSKKRKYLPNFAELLDRFTIDHLKYCFIIDKQENYKASLEEIAHDLDLLIREKDIKLTASLIQSIIILAQYNLHIWHNESAVRNGVDGAKLELTHSLNGIRSIARNKITSELGDIKGYDYKVDCLASDAKAWNPHWVKKSQIVY